MDGVPPAAQESGAAIDLGCFYYCLKCRMLKRTIGASARGRIGLDFLGSGAHSGRVAALLGRMLEKGMYC
jgi:hypothetical protein